MTPPPGLMTHKNIWYINIGHILFAVIFHLLCDDSKQTRKTLNMSFHTSASFNHSTDRKDRKHTIVLERTSAGGQKAAYWTKTIKEWCTVHACRIMKALVVKDFLFPFWEEWKKCFVWWRMGSWPLFQEEKQRKHHTFTTRGCDSSLIRHTLVIMTRQIYSFKKRTLV